MTRQKRIYSPEFKQEAIQLWQSSGKSATVIESELGITYGLLSRWKRKQDKNGQYAFPGKGRLMPEQEKIRQLEKENAILRQERDILKKAVAMLCTERTRP
ncbi:MAG: transposase [Chloroflexi bacterium]|nr:transposase [Chloroflexota bacterium]